MIFLGDDNIGLFTTKPDTQNLKQMIKNRYNMISKNQLSKTHGTFCQMVMYKNN